MKGFSRRALCLICLPVLLLSAACSGRAARDFSSPRAAVDTLMAAWAKGDRTTLLDVCGPTIDEWMVGWSDDRCFMALGKTATYTITKVTNEDDMTLHSEVTIAIDNVDCYWVAAQVEASATYQKQKERYGAQYIALTEQLAAGELSDEDKATLEGQMEKVAAALYKAYSDTFAKQAKRADAVRVQYEVTIAVRHMPMDNNQSGWVLSADGTLGDTLMGRDPSREVDE